MKRFYLSKLVIPVVIFLLGMNVHSFAQPVTFSYTGGIQTYSVAAGVTSLAVDMQGGRGGNCTYYSPALGGGGGRVQATLVTTPGTILYMYVGGVGANGVSGTGSGLVNAGGYNGGAAGYGFGGGGGGGSDIRSISGNLSSRLVVAGGGGGGAYNCTTSLGGPGGGLTGGNGQYCTGTNDGLGGNQVAGGGSSAVNGPAGFTGTFGTGGSPNTSTGVYGPGGGGGGWWGGGGASTYGGGGGGGSSYTDAAHVNAITVTHTPGYNLGTPGNGSITICPGPNTGSITGSNNVCGGGITTQLSDIGGLTGGTWSSSNATLAAVNTLTGVVTGLVTGTVTISYTVSNACAAGSAVYTMTVLPRPTAYDMLGGGAFCATGTGVDVTTDGSDPGVQYQLYNGPTAVGLPLTATGGGPIDYGLIKAAGTYTDTATIIATGCRGGLLGFANVVVNPMPDSTATHTVSAGGISSGTINYCTGSTPLHVVLSTSDLGINYQLNRNAIPVPGATVSGTGSVIDFGPEPTAGIYTVTGSNSVTGCSDNMTGNPKIGINLLPNQYPLNGGGHYCAGGSGVLVGLTNSQSSVKYQLYDGAIAEGGPVTGTTGASITFGTRSDTGNYTVIAGDTITHCSNNMGSTVTVTQDPLPNIYTVTGGGSFCLGGLGSEVKLSGSDANVSYQLYRNGVAATGPGSLVPGTGGGITFGFKTLTGTYTVSGTNTASTTHCFSNMSGSVTITINPLPAIDTIQGGGGYCSGAGRDITLSFSSTGVNYQLYNSIGAVGSPLAGTAGPLDFLTWPADPSYTVRATNATTGCNSNMFGSVAVVLNTPPTSYLVTGAGTFCSGGAGLPVGVQNSTVGVSYQLYNQHVILIGDTVAGTGHPISFGKQTLPNDYEVVARTNATGCTNNMTGTVNMTVNSLPVSHNVTGGGGYCAGGAGMPIGLDTSSLSVNYQLFSAPGVSASSLIPGNGNPLNFGTYGAAGTYTVHATDSATGCNTDMAGSATININLPPAIYPVSGGGNYCIGSSGKDIWLPSSNAGVDYQLYLNHVIHGPVAAGGGTGAIHFGLDTALGNYTVIATNNISGCTSNMSGSVNITSSPLPTQYTLSNGGGYCSGTSGLDVTLNGSNTGIAYQMYNGLLKVGTGKSGTNKAIDFGILPAGNYTIVGTNAVTGCASAMTNNDSIYINLLPTPYTVTGGGAYCSGTGGSDVGLSWSDFGLVIDIYRNGVLIDSLEGANGPLDFGYQTADGIYTMVAVNQTTYCSNNMTGNAVVSIIPLPVAYTVTGGGEYCAGGLGKHVMLSGSDANVTYQLYDTVSLFNMPGTGLAIDFGSLRGAGAYNVVATDNITHCVNNMASAAIITVDPLPTIDTVTGGGNYCFGSTVGLHVGVNATDPGVSYQLYLGSLKLGKKTGGGLALDFGLETLAGNYTVVATNTSTTCTSNMYGSKAININPVIVPVVVASSDEGGKVCAGTTTNFTAVPTYGGSSPMYQWSLNGFPIAGATNSTYSDTSINEDALTVVLTSDSMCATPTTANSNVVIMTVSPITRPSARITLSPKGDSVCAGTPILFTAVADSAGLAPTYVWMQNGSPAGTNIDNTLVVTASGSISVVVTSSDQCHAAGDSTASVSVNMTVIPPATPVLAPLKVSAGKSIVIGQTDTITATITSGGGPNPTYEWQINGVTIDGQTSNRLIGNGLITSTDVNTVVFNNHDSITCIATGSGMCGGNSVSQSLTLNVRNTTGVNQITSTISDVRIVPNPNKGTFTIKGSVGADDQVVSLEISNMLGQVVYKSNVTAINGNLNEQVQLNNTLANGMYILNVRSGTENSAFHFVIEQ